nr:MAG TPA: hypothetical protein [Bacteriophage sp.]
MGSYNHNLHLVEGIHLFPYFLGFNYEKKNNYELFS